MTALTASGIADATLPQVRATLRQVRARRRQVAIELTSLPRAAHADAYYYRQRAELVHEDAMLVMAENDCLERLGKRRQGGRVQPDFRTRNIGVRAEE